MEPENPLSSAFPLIEAIERFGHAQLVGKWIDVRARYINKQEKWPSGIPVPDPWDVYLYQRPSNGDDARISSRTLKNAWTKLTKDFLGQLIENRFVGWGRDGTPTARYVTIPADAWNVLIPDWGKDLASTPDGYTYFGIKVLPAAFVDPSWDKGLRLLDAVELIDPEMAKDLIDPWAPENDLGDRDFDWAEGSRDYARSQLWQIIHGWERKDVVSIFTRKRNNSRWRQLTEVGPIPRETEWMQVDFLASEISVESTSSPLECCLVRGREFPENFQPSPKRSSNGSSNRAKSKCEVWLLDISSEDRPKTHTKPWYWKEASRKFHGLSRRSFDIAWENSVPDSWKKSGRPSSSAQLNHRTS